jgi:hypothetical protein
MIRIKRARLLIRAGSALGAVLALGACSASLREFRLQAQKVRAHDQCRLLERAADEYLTSPYSPGLTGKPEWEPPLDSLGRLVHPTRRPSRLPNGEADLIDPWGQPIQLQFRERSDGTHYPYFTTTAPDGTPISQFGIGEASAPRR